MLNEPICAAQILHPVLGSRSRRSFEEALRLQRRESKDATHVSSARLQTLDGTQIGLSDLLDAAVSDDARVFLESEVPGSKVWFGLGSARLCSNGPVNELIWSARRRRMFVLTLVALLAWGLLVAGAIWLVPYSISKVGYDAIWALALSVIVGAGGGLACAAYAMEAIHTPRLRFCPDEDPSRAIRFSRVGTAWPSFRRFEQDFVPSAVIVVHYYRPLLDPRVVDKKHIDLFAAFLVSESLDSFHLVGARSATECLEAAQRLARSVFDDNEVPVIDLSNDVTLIVLLRKKAPARNSNSPGAVIYAKRSQR